MLTSSRTNGHFDVNPIVLWQIQIHLQKMLTEYHTYSSTETTSLGEYFDDCIDKQDDFDRGVEVLFPMSWFIDSYNDRTTLVKLHLFVVGKHQWTKLEFLRSYHAAVVLWGDGYKLNEPIQVLFQADHITPSTILHEMTHVSQMLHQALTRNKGLPFKDSTNTAEPKTELGQNNHVEFFTYSKDMALEVVKDTIRASEMAYRVGKPLTWALLYGLFRNKFNNIAVAHAQSSGFDRKTKQKFISVCYDAAYKQLLEYAIYHGIQGVP